MIIHFTSSVSMYGTFIAFCIFGILVLKLDIVAHILGQEILSNRFLNVFGSDRCKTFRKMQLYGELFTMFINGSLLRSELLVRAAAVFKQPLHTQNRLSELY